MKAAIGDDPLGKLKSVRSTLTSPKQLVDKLPLPESVKTAVQSVLPSDAPAPAPAPATGSDDTSTSKVTFAPETVEESVLVPVIAVAAATTAATAKVVSKTVVSNPEPVIDTEKTLPNENEPKLEPEVVTRPAATFSVFSYLPSYLSGVNTTDTDTETKKATIELNADDLAAVQAYLKQKGTDHKVIS
jgi:hypothetical protein